MQQRPQGLQHRFKVRKLTLDESGLPRRGISRIRATIRALDREKNPDFVQREAKRLCLLDEADPLCHISGLAAASA